MTSSAPNTQNWKAWQNLQPMAKTQLIVIGQVETSNSNQTPHLREHVPQGTNPKILLLDLAMEASGVGSTVMSWRDVRFEKDITKGQHSSITILWQGQSIAQQDVEDVH
jgi:hypothetical protein